MRRELAKLNRSIIVRKRAEPAFSRYGIHLKEGAVSADSSCLSTGVRSEILVRFKVWASAGHNSPPLFGP
jgi:hypothetical protein